ncbi:hypothetical protein SELMODRAFT_234158 [Selaginella moellendorffii]|uniref:Pre-mRNA-splicing factor 38 n=1 Tax=Selaginella moellendorffii TaxID=88036 RepID=D8SIA0_SELML|nr:hypothetical protein SELMODRAFT_234158 [Selaginella moellendorffii]
MSEFEHVLLVNVLVVDEISNRVDHLEGNFRGPSPAFCLLFKLFTMKLTDEQIQGLLNHADSPYVRAVRLLLFFGAFLIVANRELSGNGILSRHKWAGDKDGSVHSRSSLASVHYFDTIFPRIPVPVARQIASHLERLKLPTTPQGTTGRHSSEETARRPPSVKAALSVSFGQRAPHRASTRDSSPVRRSLPPSNGNNNNNNNNNNTDDRSSRGQDRTREERDRGRDREVERERPRSRDSDYRDRGRDRRDRRDREERDKDRHSSRERENRDRDRHSSRERDRDWRRERRSRSRSRSPRRSPRRRSSSPGMKDSDKNGSAANAAISANLLKLRDVYGDASGKKLEENQAARVKDSSGEDVIRLGGSSWR